MAIGSSEFKDLKPKMTWFPIDLNQHVIIRTM